MSKSTAKWFKSVMELGHPSYQRVYVDDGRAIATTPFMMVSEDGFDFRLDDLAVCFDADENKAMSDRFKKLDNAPSLAIADFDAQNLLTLLAGMNDYQTIILAISEAETTRGPGWMLTVRQGARVGFLMSLCQSKAEDHGAAEMDME